jgi:FeS assembly SUF system protein
MLGLKKKAKTDNEALRNKVIAALRAVFDPEIPVNIYDLGLIYQLTINKKQQVHIQMTLTTPGCPVAQSFPGTVEQAVNQVEGVSDCTVELVWDPPWTQERMTEAARLELGIFY